MLKLNGVNWEIHLVSPNHPALQRADKTVTIGSCDNDTKIIYIREGLPLYLMKKVLCHEITHAAMFSYNVIFTLEQEELLADLIATYGQEIIETTNQIFMRIKKREDLLN